MRKNFHRDVFIITRSPQQYKDDIDTDEKISDIGEHECSIIVFEDLLNYNQKQSESSFTNALHKHLDC